jgi:nickel/cobalt transporter (NicO) family protein
MILGLAAWMFWRTRRDVRAAAAHHHHHHAGAGPRGGQMINTGQGWVEISVYETNVPPRFRVHFYDSAQQLRQPSPASQVTIEIVWPDGRREQFSFADQWEFLEATAELGEPHEFAGKLTMAHADHAHDFPFHFAEEHEHHHHHHGSTSGEFADAHEKAHATDIEKRFADRNVTTGQIMVFGLTGGLIPCPASLTVLLVCLQLKKFTLGFTLVLCFSFGLAATMVLTGTLAALSVRHAAKHFKGFGEFARRAPYFSCALLVLMGSLISYQGWTHLPR